MVAKGTSGPITPSLCDVQTSEAYQRARLSELYLTFHVHLVSDEIGVQHIVPMLPV